MAKLCLALANAAWLVCWLGDELPPLLLLWLLLWQWHHRRRREG